MPADVVPQDEDVLISYFADGEDPNGQQCRELIRTLFFYVNQANVAAAAAQANAAAAAAAAPRALLITNAVSTDVGAIIRKTANVASITIGFHGVTKINFDPPFADTNYVVKLDGLTTPVGVTLTVTKTTGYLQLSRNDNNTPTGVINLWIW